MLCIINSSCIVRQTMVRCGMWNKIGISVTLLPERVRLPIRIRSDGGLFPSTEACHEAWM